ncbi:hypothetical protein DFJ74DRAFT_643140 [Hyaloraphidium curvatum]|nr:hypothetical protein DFJ74DRAFT_643140 [Hyaloraphidium curvatum]
MKARLSPSPPALQSGFAASGGLGPRPTAASKPRYPQNVLSARDPYRDAAQEITLRSRTAPPTDHRFAWAPAKTVRILLPDDASSEDGSNSTRSSNRSTRSAVSTGTDSFLERRTPDRERAPAADQGFRDYIGEVLADSVFTRAIAEARDRNGDSAAAAEALSDLEEVLSRIRHQHPSVLYDVCESAVRAMADNYVPEVRELLQGGRAAERKEPWSRETAIGSYMLKRWLEKCRLRELEQAQ